jgi:hypothetical protein
MRIPREMWALVLSIVVVIAAIAFMLAVFLVAR